MDDVVQMALMECGPRADWRFARTWSRLMVVRMSFAAAASAAGTAMVVVVVVAPRRKAIQRGRRRVDVGGIFSFVLFLFFPFLVSFLEGENVSGTVRFDLI